LLGIRPVALPQLDIGGIAVMQVQAFVQLFCQHQYTLAVQELELPVGSVKVILYLPPPMDSRWVELIPQLS